MEVTTMKQRKLMAILAVVLVLVLVAGVLAACNPEEEPSGPGAPATYTVLKITQVSMMKVSIHTVWVPLTFLQHGTSTPINQQAQPMSLITALTHSTPSTTTKTTVVT